MPARFYPNGLDGAATPKTTVDDPALTVTARPRLPATTTDPAVTVTRVVGFPGVNCTFHLALRPPDAVAFAVPVW